MRKLNIGCGFDIKTDHVNVDIVALPGISSSADVEAGLPFRSASFDEVLCLDVLEHVEDLTLALEEIHRVLRPGGLIRVRSSHFTSRTAWEDPTHKRALALRTLDFYCRRGLIKGRSYYFDFAFDSIEDRYLDFPKVLPWNRLAERIINTSWTRQNLYELSFLHAIFPATNVILTLRK